jgi:hypothetical protein
LTNRGKPDNKAYTLCGLGYLARVADDVGPAGLDLYRIVLLETKNGASAMVVASNVLEKWLLLGVDSPLVLERLPQKSEPPFGFINTPRAEDDDEDDEDDSEEEEEERSDDDDEDAPLDDAPLIEEEEDEWDEDDFDDDFDDDFEEDSDEDDDLILEHDDDSDDTEDGDADEEDFDDEDF